MTDNTGDVCALQDSTLPVCGLPAAGAGRGVVPSWRTAARFCSRSLPLSVGAALVVAIGLRLAMAAQGHYFFPDEHRYDLCIRFWDGVADLQPAQAVTTLFKAKARPGFVCTYLPPALIQWLLLRGWHIDPLDSSWIPAGWTALLSVANGVGVWLLARRCGGSLQAAAWAALLYGLLAPGIYYVHFLVPYVCAQTYVLGALLAIPHPAATDPGRRLLVSGALFGLAISSYPGCYDLVLPLGMLAGVGQRWRMPVVLCRGRWLALGIAGVLGAWQLLSLAGWGPTYVASLQALARTITQGDAGETWRLPFEYLWAADRGMTLILGMGSAFAALRLMRGERPSTALAVCAAALPLWYIFHLVDAARTGTVLYGRLVFQILPLVCVVAGWGLAGSNAGARRWPGTIHVAALVLAVWACWNLQPFFGLVSPGRFARTCVSSGTGIAAYVTSIGGTDMMRPDYPELDRRLHEAPVFPGHEGSAVVLANVATIFPATAFREPPDLQPICEAPHFLTVPALRFEGFDRHGRTVLGSRPLRMMVLPLPAAEQRQQWFDQWAGARHRGAPQEPPPQP